MSREPNPAHFADLPPERSRQTPNALPFRLVLTLALAALAACASDGPAPPEAGYHGNRYSEPSRGLVATLPTGWVFVAPEQLSVLKSEGADMIADRDPALASSSAAAMLSTQILCMMINAAGDEANRESITVAAEPVSDQITGLTTETYVAALSAGLRSVGYSIVKGEGPEPLEIAGLPFEPIYTRVTTSGTTLYQTYYIRVRGDEVLSVIVTHTAWGRGAALREIVQSFDLR